MCGKTVSISVGVVVPGKEVFVVGGVSISLLNGVVLGEGLVVDVWCTRGKGVIALGPLPTRILPEILSKYMYGVILKPCGPIFGHF